MNDARVREASMLSRCALIARSTDEMSALDGREANVFRVAAMVIQSRFPMESRALMNCADRYFFLHPEELTPVVNVLRNGDVISLPRLRDALSVRLRKVVEK